MKSLLLTVLAIALAAAPGAGETAPRVAAAVPIDLDVLESPGIPAPRGLYRPLHFRTAEQRNGWVVRIDSGRRPPEDAPDVRGPVPAPAVAGGRVFVGGDFHSWRLNALDASTGRHLFAVGLDDNGPSRPAVTPGGEVVTGTESCTVYGIDPVRGAVTWRNTVGPSVHTPPVAAGDRLLLSWRDEEEHFLIGALDRHDGKIAWMTEVPREVVQEPVVGLGRVFATLADHQVVCLDGKTGEKRWHADLPAAGAPVLAGGGLYVASMDGPGLTVARIDPLTGKIHWTATPPRRESRRATAPTRRDPRFGLPRGHWGDDPPMPVVLEPYVYLASGSEIVAYDSESGEIHHRLALPPGREFYAPPARTGTSLVFATRGGLLVEIDPESGDVRKALDLGVRVTSRPVLASDRVHVTSDDLVWGIPWRD